MSTTALATAYAANPYLISSPLVTAPYLVSCQYQGLLPLALTIDSCMNYSPLLESHPCVDSWYFLHLDSSQNAHRVLTAAPPLFYEQIFVDVSSPPTSPIP
jgi:hypothetical protein